jgi:hypothetical protein
MAKKKRVKEPETSPEEPEESSGEQLYDLLIPPGVPRKIIIDISQKYAVEVVSRKEKLFFANMDGDEREILAFRGKKEELEKVHDFILAELQKFVEE